MPRLFVGNYDFESTLTMGRASAVRGTPERILAELAPVWVAAALDGDFLWCPQPVDDHFFNMLHGCGLPRVCAVSSVLEIPTRLTLVPWGWTKNLVDWGESVGANVDAPPLEAVRRVNSRRFSHRFELQRGLGLPGADAAKSLAELDAAIGRLENVHSAWVVKAEFSNSSRERYLHRATDPADRQALHHWAQRRLTTGQSLFVEPWIDRLDEVGVQITIPREGKPRFEGLTRLLVDHAGRYRGSEFTPTSDHDPEWQETVWTALELARDAQGRGYFGPLGVDAMKYRTADGEIRLRPVQDVNARWTMGRLSLGLRRLLRPGERGIWFHGPRSSSNLRTGDEINGSPPQDPVRAFRPLVPEGLSGDVRTIVTSPDVIADRPVHHVSVVCLWGHAAGPAADSPPAPL